jgi:lantibiotic transport system permease protein
MNKFLILFCVEIAKLKRSQALVMTLLCPFAVILLQLLVVIEGNGDFITKRGWNMYWMSVVSLWYSFMLPLYIALITGLLTSLEHKNHGWRLMATLPISRVQLYIAKTLLAWALMAIGSLWLYLLTGLSIGLLLLLGYQGGDILHWSFVSQLCPVLVAALPIVVIGMTVSWLIPSMVPALVLGVSMTMAAMSVSRSPDYWMFDPWTYPMVATMVQGVAVRELAMALGAVVGVILLLAGCWYCTRRPIHS